METIEVGGEPARQEVVINLDSEADAQICESYLLSLMGNINYDITLRIVSSFSSKFFSDIWIAMLIGSICLMPRKRLKIIAWGLLDWKSSRYFQRTIPGIVAFQMGDKIESDYAKDVLSSSHIFAGKYRWLSSRANSRTIFELDPQSEGEAPLLPERLNEYLIEAASEIDLGYLAKEKKAGTSVIELLSFYSELYDNSYNYSRSWLPNGHNMRIMRLKSHIYATPGELVKRAGEDGPLREYLESVVDFHGHHGVMEATVSDFGPGIINHFVSSPKGVFYENLDRIEILQLLINTALTSKSDSGAGQGLPRVISAASGLRAYLSLRTNEFQMTKSYANKEFVTTEMEAQPSKAKVAGTHWQLLWPMIGLDNVFT